MAVETLSLSSPSKTEDGRLVFGVKTSTSADTEATLQAIRKGLESKKDFYQDKIDANTNKLTALSALKTKLLALQSAANKLRVPNPLSATPDAFADRTISGYSGNSTNFSMIANIIQTGTPSLGTHTFTINRLADSDTITDTAPSATFTDVNSETLTTHATANSHTWTDGELIINGTSISLTSDMTLTDAISAINAVNDTTDVQASYVTVASGSYRLKLSSKVTGAAITLSDTNSVLTSLDLAESGETDTSLSAEIIVDGDTLTRTTNTVSDAIDGLTLELKQADNSATNYVVVGNAQDSIMSATDEFITAYNDLVQFKKDQTKSNGDGIIDEDSVLNNNMFMRNLVMAYNTFIVSSATGLSGSTAIETLAEAGISLDVDGFLSFQEQNLTNQDVFLSNVLNNADELKKTFGFVTTSTNADFLVVDHQFQLSDTIAGQNITVTLSTDASSNYSVVFTVDGVDYDGTYSSGTITGNEGTPFEGIELRYTGADLGASSSASSTITMTQGVADKLAISLESILEDLTGAFTQEVSTYTESNKDLEDQVSNIQAKIDKQMETFRKQFEMVTSIQAKYLALSNSLDAMMNVGK